MSDSNTRGNYWSTPHGAAVIFMIFAVSYFLWTEHRAHVIEALPWVIVRICPLMHVFMHRGHGHHGSDDGRAGSSTDKKGEE